MPLTFEPFRSCLSIVEVSNLPCQWKEEMTQLVIPSAVETPFHFGEVVVSLILALAEFLEKAMEREGHGERRRC